MHAKRARHYIAEEEKVAILRRNLWGKVLVSKPCEEQELQPKMFHRLRNE